MSEITTQVKFTTRMDKVIETESTRYALNAVQVIPAGEGTVFATGTDSRCMVVKPCEGTTDKPALVPHSVLPRKNSAKGTTVTLNGRWESSDGRFANSDTVEGRFPRCSDVVPDPIHGGDYRCVSVDVALLANMAAALGTTKLTILVAEEGEDTFNGSPVQCVRKPLIVLPSQFERHSREEGFGVVMPLTVDRGAELRSMRDQRQAYIDAVNAAK